MNEISYVWQAGDVIWDVLYTHWAPSGWPDVPTFAQQVFARNAIGVPNSPQLYDWRQGRVPVGTVIFLPYAN